MSPKHLRTDIRWVEYRGRKWRLCDLADKHGIGRAALWARVVKKKMSIEDALNVPLRSQTRRSFFRKVEGDAATTKSRTSKRHYEVDWGD
jgi:hypothetical protein